MGLGLAALATLATSRGLAAPASAAGTSGAFAILLGRDTIGVESFTRTPAGRAEGTLVFRLGNLRIDYTMDLAADGAVKRMVSAVREASAPVDSPATQTATLEWRADSVLVALEPGGPQRLASRRGSMPYVNPSAFMLELALGRARAVSPPRDTVPMFVLGGGRTAPLVLRKAGGDTIVATLATTEFVLRVDRNGRILSGAVPAQGVRYERAASLPGQALAPARPDYSPPPGALYRAEAVRIPTRGGFELAGTLTRPARAGAAPCVLTITGSGPQDRDEAIPLVKGYRPFRQIADTLARRGIAVLRLDDRGTGESGGRFAGSTSAGFTDDVEDALKWLKRAPRIDPTRLGLLGHSEGGLIAPLAALRDTTLRALVLLAAPAWDGRRILAYQSEWSARKRLSGAALDSALAASRAAVDSLAKLDLWLGFFVGYDPLPAARKLARPPVLLLQGETDRQVAAEQASELAAAFEAAGNRDVTLHVLPATNHLFLPDSSGDPARYPLLASGAIPRETLGLIADWLEARFFRRSRSPR